MRALREKLVLAACILLAASVVRICLFTTVRVDGASMQPTLAHGESLLVSIADVRLGGLHRGDVVVCRYPGRDGVLFVKRIAAGPGDVIYKQNGVTHAAYPIAVEERMVTLADLPLDPGSFTLNPAGDCTPVLLDAGEYFVVGDNLYNSHDSRDLNRVGPISEDMILGRVRCVFWPLTHFRLIA